MYLGLFLKLRRKAVLSKNIFCDLPGVGEQSDFHIDQRKLEKRKTVLPHSSIIVKGTNKRCENGRYLEETKYMPHIYCNPRFREQLQSCVKTNVYSMSPVL